MRYGRKFYQVDDGYGAVRGAYIAVKPQSWSQERGAMLARYHENRRDKKNRKQKDDAKFRGPIHTNDFESSISGRGTACRARCCPDAYARCRLSIVAFAGPLVAATRLT
jgi:hypothetical protein